MLALAPALTLIASVCEAVMFPYKTVFPPEHNPRAADMLAHFVAACLLSGGIGLAATVYGIMRKSYRNLLEVQEYSCVVVTYAAQNFGSLDKDGDGVLTLHDLDAVWASSVGEVEWRCFLRDKLPDIGHKVGTEPVATMARVWNMLTNASESLPQLSTVDAYGISQKDLASYPARLKRKHRPWLD